MFYNFHLTLWILDFNFAKCILTVMFHIISYFFFFGIFSRFLIFGPTNKHFIHYLLLYTLHSIYFGFFFLDYSSFRGQLRVEEHAVAWPREGKHEEETIEKMHSCIKNPFPLSFSYQFLFFSL